MPWRARYIVPRPHPLAVSVYLIVLLLGVFSIAGIFNFNAINAIIGTSWHYMWAWLLTVGGCASIIGVHAKNDLEGGLLLEAVGAGASSLGFFVYTACYLDVFGILFDSRISGWLFYLILGVGCFIRSIQALRDRRLATQLGSAVDKIAEETERDAP